MIKGSNLLQQNLSGVSDDISKNSHSLLRNIFCKKDFEQLVLAFEDKTPQLKKACIGKGDSKSVNVQVRGDFNLWLDSDDHSFDPLWGALEQVTSIAKKDLFLPLKRYEAQMALYKPGTCYSRHTDQHEGSPHRLLTLVFYLSDWSQGHGGELVLYDSRGPLQKILPQQNSLIIFRSDLQHEVLTTNVERKSISAWLRNDIL